ncbi:MAG: glycosyltransferase family 2 protein [Cetobacterium sp.]
MGLSVGIITFNEERIIGKTLSAVKEIADEIIIVDSFSSDRTVEIAKSFGAVVFQESWKGFGPQKNSAIEKCKENWILLIDADEVISPELAHKIKEISSQQESRAVYEINRCSVCFGKELKHGGWSNQYATRLWRKGDVTVNNNLVHENYITEKPLEKIREKIYHYSYLTMEDYFNKFNKYTTLGALEYYNRGRKPGIFQLTLNPLFKFIRMYILRFGFLDGIEGFAIASASGMYSMVKYFKLREIYRNGVYKKDEK